MTSRRTVYLREMGIAPAWKLRESAQDTVSASIETPAVAVAAAESPAALPSDWDSLEASVASCNACGLCGGRKRVVLGVGDRSASWLIVGEGPGYHEDQQGEPFVGRSGQLLDAMLRAMGLRRGDGVYIANIVKCRATDTAGKDRPPTPEEAAACMPHLEAQIALIQPDIIVSVGRIAAVHLLGADPETTLASLRGKVHRIQRVGRNIPMVATYHPSYLLRTPIAKKQAWADLCLAMRVRAGETENC